MLQTQRVRLVGDPVALVVAETRTQAQDAAELIAIDYDILPSVTDTAAALAPDAPVIWEERGSNLCVLWDSGRGEEAEAAFARAARTSSASTSSTTAWSATRWSRASPSANTTRRRRATPCARPTQGVIRVRDGLAQHILKVPNEKLRVISPDVGGGFGLRGKLLPESGMVLWAARRLGRPVKWRSDRTETFLCDPHGRDHVTRGRDGFRRGGHAPSACASAPSPPWAPTCRISARACRPSPAGASTARSTTSRR